MAHNGSLYENWSSGEPNDAYGEDCTALYSSGKWNDLKCSVTSPIAICEKETCIDPIGIEDGSIPSDQLTASSEFNQSLGAHRGRLNTIEDEDGYGAWLAETNDDSPWIQADLGAVKEVTGVITQGRSDKDKWVTSYEVRHCVDGNNFEPIIGASGQDEEFNGNLDRDTTVTNMFNAAVYARFIRIHPTGWYGNISLRFELLGCTESCSNLLGIEDGTIPSDQLTASSELNQSHGAHRGRLNTIENEGGYGAWSAASSDNDQWIQANLSAVKEITGVITQGHSDYDQWVTSFEVRYSVDGNNLESVIGASCHEEEFNGNLDRNTTVINMFNAAVYAQFIRIHPTSWYGNISLRFELLGCTDTKQSTLTCPSDTTVDTDMGAATASVDYSGTISASDNSGVVPVISPDPTTTFPANLGIGSNPFTFTATDSSGNTDICTFTITVKDTEQPTLTCPSDATVYTDVVAAMDLVNYTGTVSARDNSGAVPTISPDPTATFPASLGFGPNPFMFTATDSAGNVDTCIFTITVQAFRSRLMGRKENGPLKHHMIRTIHTQSAIRCAAHCMTEPLCVSMHFGTDTCQLYGISGGDDEDDVIRYTNMAYYENIQQ